MTERDRCRAGRTTIGPDDPRYGDLAGRGSARFAGKPDQIELASSTEQVVAAVQDAVRTKRRVAVRSGGHCLEAFVADPAVRSSTAPSRSGAARPAQCRSPG
jgi:FAD/FMN-containing dehydrogenase